MSAVLILQQRQTFKKTLTHGDSCTLTIIKSWHTRENQNNNSYPQLMLILLTLDTTVYICVSVVSNFICKLYPIICIHTIHLILSSEVLSNYAKSFFSVNWQAFAVSTTHTTNKNQMLSKWECGHGKMWVNPVTGLYRVQLKFGLWTDLLRSCGCEAHGSAGDSSSDPAAQGWCPLQQVIWNISFWFNSFLRGVVKKLSCIETCP